MKSSDIVMKLGEILSPHFLAPHISETSGGKPYRAELPRGPTRLVILERSL
jgi:hypothetical protein